MIKFFRKIRKNMIKENKASKYMLYAVGEIILVIIGILIALAISDWNGKRLEKKSEIHILSELRKGILMDLELIINEQKLVIDAIDDIKLLQSLIKNQDQVYKKGMDTLFGVVYGIRAINLNHAFYQDLKSSGLNLIKNENLRVKIVELFENHYHFITELRAGEISINQVNRPYYLNHFHDLLFYKTATPNDFKFIWSDKYYHNIIDYRLINLEYNQVVIYEKTIKTIRNLSQKIESYINEETK